MVKLFVDNTVYIPVGELEVSKICRLGDATFHDINIGNQTVLAITEDEYNRIVSGDELEITKVDTLSVRLADAKRLLPLKAMFLSSMMPKSEISRKLQKEMQEEYRKGVSELSDVSDTRIASYQETEALWRRLRGILAEHTHGMLDIQFITEITERGAIGVIPFLVGEGVFYELLSSEWGEGQIAMIEYSNGELRIPNMYYESEEDDEICTYAIHSSKRDFRQYSVRENIVWCLRNLHLRNDFADELLVDEGAVYFSCTIRMIAKLFNDKSFMDYYLFGELLNDIQEVVISTHPNGNVET